MRFLADHDVFGSTIRFLLALGHDVTPVAKIGLAEGQDADLLRLAQSQGQIFITRDRDLGGLVFVRGAGPGVIYLRMSPGTINATHAELQRVVESYRQEELLRSFVVVEPGRHRIRRL